MHNEINKFINFINEHHGIGDKAALINHLKGKFSLTKDRSVFYCEQFSVRFSSSKNKSFSNTVLSLSNLRKYDDLPFFVCLVTPEENYLYLANSSFLKKISQSSQALRIDNIRGSFNGSDIFTEFQGIDNKPENFATLYSLHAELGFQENLPRLVEATNNIIPTGSKFEAKLYQKEVILRAPERACDFMNSLHYNDLKNELDKQVSDYKNEIIIASLIENVNIRGRIIEYLIAGKDDELRNQIIEGLKNPNHNIPQFKTDNKLGDYHKVYDDYITETDIKTKIMVLNSNPKAYNLDKMLEFLAEDGTVFLFYFIGIDPKEITNTTLISIFQTKLLSKTFVHKHWAGRNSRGVTQFEGKTVSELLYSGDNDIDRESALVFLNEVLSL